MQLVARPPLKEHEAAVPVKVLLARVVPHVPRHVAQAKGILECVPLSVRGQRGGCLAPAHRLRHVSPVAGPRVPRLQESARRPM